MRVSDVIEEYQEGENVIDAAAAVSEINPVNHEIRMCCLGYLDRSLVIPTVLCHLVPYSSNPLVLSLR